MTLGAAPSRFAPKMILAEWRALWRFSAVARHIGETMQTVRRAESSGGRRSTRLHRRISHDTRGRTVTFCAKNDLGRMEGLVALLSACSTHRRDDAGAFAAPNRQAEGEVHGLHRRISHDTRGRTVALCAKNNVEGMEGLMAFRSAWSTYRRDDADAFAAPNRQADGEVHAFTAGYRMTLGAPPPRFAPKMMASEWRALSASFVPSAGPCA